MQGSIKYSSPQQRQLFDPLSPPTPICKAAGYITIKHKRKKHVPKTPDAARAIDYLCNKSPEVITPAKVSYDAQSERLSETLLEENSMTDRDYYSEDDEDEEKMKAVQYLTLRTKFRGRKLKFETPT